MNLQWYHPIKLFKRCNFNSRHISASIGKSNYLSDHYRYTSDKHTYARPDWNKAVSDAEKIVGYPTSFLSLRWLLSDEIANVALHLRKLVGSNHPLLKTAKHLLYNNSNNMQAYGLIVLLISKTVGYNTNIDELNKDKSAGVLHSQRALAEVTEMIRTSHLIHKGLINIYPGLYKENDTLNDMTFGNKIALLSGDYLLSNSCAELAALKNQYLVELMSSAVRDLAEAEFIGRQDGQNNPLPPENLGHDFDGSNQTKLNGYNQTNISEDYVDNHRNNLNKNSDKNWNYLYVESTQDIKNENNINKNEIETVLEEILINKNLNISKFKIKNNEIIKYLFSKSESVKDWTYRNILLGANLLGKACQGTILLADQNKIIQKQGYDFGIHLALSWQAFIEIEQYQTLSATLSSSSSIESSANEYFNLTSAPVLFHLEYSKPFLRQSAYKEIEKGIDNVQNINHNKILHLIAEGPGVQLTKLLQNYHSIKALNILDKFEKSDARNALVNIIKVMGNI